MSLRSIKKMHFALQTLIGVVCLASLAIAFTWPGGKSETKLSKWGKLRVVHKAMETKAGTVRLTKGRYMHFSHEDSIAYALARATQGKSDRLNFDKVYESLILAPCREAKERSSAGRHTDKLKLKTGKQKFSPAQVNKFCDTLLRDPDTGKLKGAYERMVSNTFDWIDKTRKGKARR